MAATRKSAARAANEPGSGLSLESGALGPGLREWLPGLPAGDGSAAAVFDTRMNGPVLFTGQASRAVAHQLRRHDYEVLTPVHSFVVSKENVLEEARPSGLGPGRSGLLCGRFYTQSTPEF